MINIIISIKKLRTEREYLIYLATGRGREKGVSTLRMLGPSLDVKRCVERLLLINQEG